MIDSKLTEGLQMLGLVLPDESRARMMAHFNAVDAARGKLNLTSVSGREDLLIKHLLDSIVMAPLVKGRSVLDIGTGAGFPGMVLAAALPEVTVTCLDSRMRRIEFLRWVSAKAGFENTRFVCSRVEQYQPEAKFDTLTARAVTSLENLLALTTHLKFKGQQLLAMKGVYPEPELRALDGLPGISVQTQRLDVPFLDAERHCVIIQREES